MLTWFNKNGHSGVHSRVSKNTNGLHLLQKPNLKPNNNSFPAENGAAPLILLHGIEKEYDTAAGPFLALKGIDLSVKEGEFLAVVGKSGSGKSTLINMLTGIDHPTKGAVQIGQTRLDELNEGEMAIWRGRTMGIVFQFFQLLPALTILENILIPMDLAQLYDPRERISRAMALLEEVEMADDANKFPGAVSGGQQQRAAIARALANDPPIIVADEPTGNLDSKAAETIYRLFEKLVSRHKTILMVTHDDELAGRAPRKVTIADGLIVEEVDRQIGAGKKHLSRTVHRPV